MILQGARTWLRPMAREDLALLHRWLNDPDVMQYWDGRDHPATFDRVEARFRRSVEGSDREAHRFMIEADDPQGVRQTIGMAQHGRVHPRAKNAQIDMLIGERAFRDAGYGSDAMRAMLRHLFEQLKLQRVWLTMRASNAAAMKAVLKGGFVQEGVLRNHDQLEGKLVDVVVYGMLADEWAKLANEP